MGIFNRLKLVQYYSVNKEIQNRTNFKELLYHLTVSDCKSIAAKHSVKVHQDEDFDYYRIEGFSSLFNYPKDVPYHNFAQVISEGFQPKFWHYYEVEETPVEPDEIIADCGSAEGFFAFKHQHKVRKIYAIEPLPLFIKSLNKLFLGSKTVDIVPIALGSKVGSAFLKDQKLSSFIKDSLTKQDNPNDFQKVTIETLDSLFAHKNIEVSYIKGDLEGYEENVIRGGLETIRLFKPKIAITTYHKGQDYRELIRVVKSVVPSYKYRLKGIESREGNPVMLHMWV